MTGMDEDLIRLIDARIARAAKKDRSMGTIQSRDRTGPGAMVVFDGAVVGIPCKVPGTVHAFEGDRVALMDYGGEWIVMTTYNRRGLGSDYAANVFPGGTKADGVWEDLPGSPTLTVVKRYDSTVLGIDMKGSAYATGSAAKVNFGVRITNPAAAYDNDNSVYLFLINPLLQHTFFSGTNWTPDGVPPAGTYTITGRWRREDGTGTLNVDGSDWYSIHVSEQEPGGV